jgi:hypothetical protein
MTLDTTHYISSHSDLIMATKKMSPIQKHQFALNHFNKYGKAEGRIYRSTSNSDFDFKSKHLTVDTVLPKIQRLINKFKQLCSEDSGQKTRDKCTFVKIK